MIEVTRLSSGYWHIRGIGPCNWAQPPTWPCDETTFLAHAFPEASDEFIREAMAEVILKPDPRAVMEIRMTPEPWKTRSD